MTTKYRYEIGVEGDAREFAASFSPAMRHAKDIGEGAYVYDRMARYGAPELWRVRSGKLVLVNLRDAKGPRHA